MWLLPEITLPQGTARTVRPLGPIESERRANMTPQQREAERIARRLKLGHARGARNAQSKLDDAKVRSIRLARALGHLQVDIARRFGVSPATVQAVLRGRTWRHVR